MNTPRAFPLLTWCRLEGKLDLKGVTSMTFEREST